LKVILTGHAHNVEIPIASIHSSWERMFPEEGFNVLWQVRQGSSEGEEEGSKEEEVSLGSSS
jgi:hypothetical protein